MKTAEEYKKQIKMIADHIGLLERTLLNAQMNEYPDFPHIKACRQCISNLETKMKYVSSQHRKAERIEAREDAYIKTFKS